MTFRLIPRDVKFFDLFAAAGQNLAQAATKLLELVTNFDHLDVRIAEIQALEKEGDKVDHAINARIATAFVTPFDREDIHDLTVKVDDMVDYIQAVAESLVIYDVRQPTDECVALADLLARQSNELAAVLVKLEGMKGLSGHLDLIHDLEHQADTVSRAAVGRLFRENHDPLDVIKWRDIYMAIEEAIDAGEDAAEAIERMVHKRV